jgi:hypothetical protein
MPNRSCQDVAGTCVRNPETDTSGHVMDSTPDRLTQRVIDLLGASLPAWSTVRGTLYSLYEEAVTHPEAVSRNTTDNSEFGRIEGSYRFWATASPWQLRLEALHQIVPRGRHDATMPDVLITDRWTWQATRGGHVRGGGWPPDQIITDREGKHWAIYDDVIMPDPGHRYHTPGLENLDVLLKPAPLLRGFHFVEATPVQHGDRAGIQVRAVPRERDDFHRWAGGLVVLGADSYVFAIDSTHGIVLDVTISIGGQVGRRHTLSDLHFGDVIDQELFRQSRLEIEPG